MNAVITNLSSYKALNDEGNKLMLRDFRVHLIAGSKSPETIKKRVYDVTRLARVYPLYEVTLQDIENHLAANCHLAEETRRGRLASWKVFYEWAHLTGRIEQNPTQGLSAIKVPHRYPRVAPDHAIQEAIPTAPLIAKGMILLARLACLRLSELTNLPQSAREGDRLRFIGKGNKERIVYLHPELEHILKRLEEIHAGSPYYFPGRFGGAMHPQSVNKIIKHHTGWNPHSLRHAGATAAYRATRDIRSVQEMLGHSSLATTQRYLHVDEDGLRAAALGTSMLTNSARLVA